MLTPLESVKKKRAEAVSRIIGKGYLSTKRVFVGMARDAWELAGRPRW